MISPLSISGSVDEKFEGTEPKLMRCLPRAQILSTSSVLAAWHQPL
jgi:hypothetical protein